MHQFSGMCLGLSDRYGTAEFGHKTWNLKKRLQSQRAVLQSQLLALGENSPKCSERLTFEKNFRRLMNFRQPTFTTFQGRLMVPCTCAGVSPMSRQWAPQKELRAKIRHFGHSRRQRSSSRP